MRILVAPDSFKGSLSAVEAARIMADAIRQELSQASVHAFPMADGGEGTVEAVLAGTGGRLVRLTATGPTGTPVRTFYGIIDHTTAIPIGGRRPDPARQADHHQQPVHQDHHEQTDQHEQNDLQGLHPSPSGTAVAVLETAAVAGLTMVPPEQRNPLLMTTFGLGECIRHALDHGIRRFLIGLGGSAANDGGLGMLQALGAAFYDPAGNRLPDFKPAIPAPTDLAPAGPAAMMDGRLHDPGAPQPGTVLEWMSRIARVDFSTLDPRLREADIVVASDVQSPLCGPQGASVVFGPQKGATPEQVRQLDEALANYAEQVERHLGRTFQHHPGAGAAGGLGFAFLCLGGRIESGARLIIEVSGLAGQLPHADWLITGEGRTDEQTLLGKLPVTLADMARAHGVRTILVSGSLTGDEQTLEKLYRRFDAVFAIPNRPMSLEEAMRDVRPLLKTTARNIARLIAASGP